MCLSWKEKGIFDNIRKYFDNIEFVVVATANEWTSKHSLFPRQSPQWLSFYRQFVTLLSYLYTYLCSSSSMSEEQGAFTLQMIIYCNIPSFIIKLSRVNLCSALTETTIKIHIQPKLPDLHKKSIIARKDKGSNEIFCLSILFTTQCNILLPSPRVNNSTLSLSQHRSVIKPTSKYNYYSLMNFVCCQYSLLHFCF